MTGEQREQRPPNKECLDCPVKSACKQLITGWKEHKTRRPAFIASIVRMAIKQGTEMLCLRDDAE